MRSLLTVSLMLVCCVAVFADVAPDVGYTNISSNLVLETDADLSGYRFFLESAMKVEEIKIKSGGPTQIDATGRAGAARVGKLIAVPVKDLSVISGDLSGALLESMIREKRFPNAQVLLSHYFQATIPINEKSGWQDPVYRVSVAGDLISATPISGGPLAGRRLTYSVWQFVWPVAVAGTLLAIGLAIAGVWLIRRKKRIV